MKGKQDEPANGRPVSIFSHTRKRIDAEILGVVTEYFTPPRAKFGLQSRISVLQALLQAQTHAAQGLKHVAVLDLAKAHDKVDRKSTEGTYIVDRI